VQSSRAYCARNAIMQMVAKTSETRKIAAANPISEGTVITHRGNIYSKWPAMSDGRSFMAIGGSHSDSINRRWSTVGWARTASIPVHSTDERFEGLLQAMLQCDHATQHGTVSLNGRARARREPRPYLSRSTPTRLSNLSSTSTGMLPAWRTALAMAWPDPQKLVFPAAGHARGFP